ncbi:MAG: hypothetical protein GF393_07365 [Armatimonadia bacterium]|nr:hypothetical protein [Armatimonadia bacterium]
MTSLTLYIDRNAENAEQIVEMTEMLRERHLPETVQLEIVDVGSTPQAARDAGVLAVPTLELDDGTRIRRAVGHLGNVESILKALGWDGAESEMPGADDQNH